MSPERFARACGERRGLPPPSGRKTAGASPAARSALTRTARRGFTLVEVMVAIGVLGVVLLLVAQTAVLILAERQRDAARQQALEAAANVLEAARACPWEELNAAWAARQRLPDSLAGPPHDGRLTVRVEAEPSRPHVKRVTVEVRWSPDGRAPEQQVQLIGLRGARATAATGGKS